MVSDFKAPSRIIEDKEGWEQLRRIKLAPCRVCGETWLPTLHHLVPRSLGGDDVPDNLVPVCGHGTRGCHGLIEAHDPETLARLRAALTTAEAAYVLRKKGLPFLDRYYPAASDAA